ncbi:MAG: MBL fold metallo-hydrolase [Weeksellaceae bacterium]
MKIQRFPLGEMQANAYLLEQDGECLIIDPADSGDFLLEQIERMNGLLVGMMATHGHFDHVMATGEIQLTHPEIPLYIHEEDQFLLDRVVESAEHFLTTEPAVIPIQFVEYLYEETVMIGSFTFNIIHTPGHTPGSVSIYLPEEKVMFTGDALFKDGIGRTDFKYSEKEVLQKSIATIMSYPPETTIYSGHGEETTIEEQQSLKDMSASVNS